MCPPEVSEGRRRDVIICESLHASLCRYWAKGNHWDCYWYTPLPELLDSVVRLVIVSIGVDPLRLSISHPVMLCSDTTVLSLATIDLIDDPTHMVLSQAVEMWYNTGGH